MEFFLSDSTVIEKTSHKRYNNVKDGGK
jgi:hypothetical protein